MLSTFLAVGVRLRYSLNKLSHAPAAIKVIAVLLSKAYLATLLAGAGVTSTFTVSSTSNAAVI